MSDNVIILQKHPLTFKEFDEACRAADDATKRVGGHLFDEEPIKMSSACRFCQTRYVNANRVCPAWFPTFLTYLAQELTGERHIPMEVKR